jgi:hypothetical protein
MAIMRREKMKFRLLIVVLLLATVPLSAQRSRRGDTTIKNVTFVHEISEKDAVSFGDTVRFLVLILGKEPTNTLASDLDILKSAGITAGLNYAENISIKKGMLALILADYLKLGDSLFYMIFKTQRYAFTACIANGIMDYDASEYDSVSGGELIEIMSKVSERASGGKE